MVAACSFREDFSAFPEGELAEGLVGGWDLQGPHLSAQGRIRPLTAEGGARRRDDAWQDFRLECDVFNRRASFGIQIGGDTYSRFFLHIDKAGRSRATLAWIFTPPPGSDLPARQETFETDVPIDFPVSHGGVPAGSRLSLEMAEGRLRASITQRVFWHGSAQNFNGLWSTLAAIGDVLVVTAGFTWVGAENGIERGFTVTGEGEGTRRQDLVDVVSETRSWIDSDGAQRLGICLPTLSQLRIGTVRNPHSWDQFLSTRIGPFLGKKGHSLHFPISFDVAPDGRIYVLDASNGVDVLDKDGIHIAEWAVEPLSGPIPRWNSGVLKGSTSIAVDEDGFIYVADAVNRRIQKFEP